MLLAAPKAKTKLYGDRSLAAKAPRLWNAQPVDPMNSDSLNIFKSKVRGLLSASAIDYRDHIIVEYRNYYNHYYY